MYKEVQLDTASWSHYNIITIAPAGQASLNKPINMMEEHSYKW